MISIVIPMHNQHEMTDKCIDNLLKLADSNLQITVIDNASDPPYVNEKITVIRNDENPGVWPSLMRGISASVGDIIVTMHNDVLIHEQGWDTKLAVKFEAYPKLGLVGLFGGRGVCGEGGRGHPESNMIAKEWGSHGRLHGQILTTFHPAVVLDSLFMAFSSKILKKVIAASPYYMDNMPIHHFFDRICCLLFVKAGFQVGTIGLAFDHYGGATSTKSGHQEAVLKWCNSKGLTIDQNPDYTMYMYGRALYHKLFTEVTGLPPLSSSQLWVDQNYNYSLRKKG